MTAGKRPPRPWEHTFLDAIRAGENLAGGARIAGSAVDYVVFRSG